MLTEEYSKSYFTRAARDRGSVQIKGAVNTLNPSALHRRRSRETPAAMGIPIRRRQVPGILIESRRSSIVRRKSLDNAMLLDDHAARLVLPLFRHLCKLTTC